MDGVNWPSCVVCGAKDSATELCRTSFGRIIGCGRCGLVRTTPPRSPEQLARLHADPAYFHHPYFGPRRAVEGEQARQKYRRILGLLLNGFDTRGLRLLDVGCDTGGLLVVARDEFGMTVTGVEVSATAAQVARSAHRLEVLAGDLAEAELSSRSFDAITLVDLIEHVADPNALLANVHSLLREGGRLYVATSDHDALINSLSLALYRMLGRRSWPLLEKLYIPYHEFYFNSATLARLVRQAGFRVLHHASLEFPLDEFGHGRLLKLALALAFLCQRLLRKQTLQELVAVKAP